MFIPNFFPALDSETKIIGSICNQRRRSLRARRRFLWLVFIGRARETRKGEGRPLLLFSLRACARPRSFFVRSKIRLVLGGLEMTPLESRKYTTVDFVGLTYYRIKQRQSTRPR